MTLALNLTSAALLFGFTLCGPTWIGIACGFGCLITAGVGLNHSQQQRKD